MKKITTLIPFAFLAFALVSCATTKTAETAKSPVNATESQITDWSNRNLDVEAKPEWLKKLVCGNSDEFKKQFGIKSDYVIKYGVANTKTRDSALAASRVNYNAMRAEELKTKVVSEANSQLNNDGYTEAMAGASTLAKVDISGHELVTQFWQKVETTEEDVKNTEYICYSVYKISKESWANTLKGFLAQVIPAIPDSEAQVKMANRMKSLYDETTHEQELSEQVVLAQIRAQEENAKARVAEANAKAAQANATVAEKEVAKTVSNDLDWMSALSTAASLLF